MHDIVSGIDARYPLLLCQAKQWKDRLEPPQSAEQAIHHFIPIVHTEKWALDTSAQNYSWYITTEKTKQYEKGRRTLPRWASPALFRQVHHYRAHCKGPRSLKIRPQIYTLFCEHTCIQLQLYSREKKIFIRLNRSDNTDEKRKQLKLWITYHKCTTISIIQVTKNNLPQRHNISILQVTKNNLPQRHK